jgi:hypothetical protein
MMAPESAALLRVAGSASFAIGLLQFIMYFGGPNVYRFCGTPELLIEFRLRRPGAAFFTEVAIALVFAAFATYAYAATGWLRPLPLVARGLAITAAIYLLRGLLIIPQAIRSRKSASVRLRDLLYSLMALALGVSYALPAYWYWEALVSRAGN